MDEEVNLILRRMGVRGYTKWREITGEGESDPHLGTEVWPLLNHMIMVACDGDVKERLKEMVGQLRQTFPGAGIRMFVTPLTELV